MILWFLNPSERKAFWINAYNALTIKAVLDLMPSSGVVDPSFSVKKISDFFNKITYDIAGEKLTLDSIENEKLRKGFRDPRIHFVIVCASRSCPEIQNKVYLAEKLHVRLNEAARLFIRDNSKNRLDKQSGILHISKIFKWYSSDFKDNAGTVVEYIKNYVAENDAVYLSKNKVKRRYLYYDWLLNIKHSNKK